MDIVVDHVEGVPDRAYLSIRVGDARKQTKLKLNDSFHFDVQSMPKSFVLDVFQQVGTKKVSTKDLGQPDGDAGVAHNFDVKGLDGSAMKFGMKVHMKSEVVGETENKSGTSTNAQTYLDQHRVGRILQDVVHGLIKTRPQDPLGFMLDYIGRQRDAAIAKQPPNVDRSLAAALFEQEPGLYDRFLGVKTSFGVSLGQCTRTGIHNTARTPGLVAGDEFCYDMFQDVFSPVIKQWHGTTAHTTHQTDLDATKVSSSAMDRDDGRHVVRVQMCCSRNISGMRMSPAITTEERSTVERLIAASLLRLEGDLHGDYYPLGSKDSYTPRPDGMSKDTAIWLRNEGLLIEEPDAKVTFGRHWPEARGVFVSDDQDAVVWVNDSDHVRIMVRQAGGGEWTGNALFRAFKRLVRLDSALRDALQEAGHAYAQSSKYGFLTTCPSKLGTAVCASVRMRLPRLSRQSGFDEMRSVFRCGLAMRMLTTEDGLWEAESPSRIGMTEVCQIGELIESCKLLVDLEMKLEAGETAIDLSKVQAPQAPPAVAACDATMADFASVPGLGDADYPGFSAESCPDELPSLKNHCSIMAEVLRQDETIYTKLKALKTRLGVPFARCVKPGFDNCGHTMIKTVGAVAGDAECYELFAPFFDAVIQRRLPGIALDRGHCSDTSCEKVSAATMDPSGRYVLNVRARVSRNLEGLRFPPAISRDERRESERVLVKALVQLAEGGTNIGEYFPLACSNSYVPKPGGMNSEEEAALRSEGLLFQEPDAALMLASGVGRHWPEARGVFVARSQSLAAWINEEDHFRLAAMETGADLRGVFSRLFLAEAEVGRSVEAENHKFAFNGRLGFLSTCPSKIGTGLQVEVLVKLPLLSADPGFRPLCRRLSLQARVAAFENGVGINNGAWDVSNLVRLGSSEVEQVNLVIDGVRQLVDLEMKLTSGEQVELANIAPDMSG